MTTERDFTRDEIKLLYAASKAIKRPLGLSWPSFFTEHVGLHIGTNYEANFRRGNIGQTAANSIHAWIAANHLNIGIEAAPELFDGSLRTDWQKFLDQYAQYGPAKTVAHGGLGLTEHSAGNPIAGSIRLGAEFHFALETDFEGSVLALEEYQGSWHGLPLGQDGAELTATIAPSQTALPFDAETGEPIALRERSDLGEHGYLFIVASPTLIKACSRGIHAGQRVLPRQLNQLAHRLEQEDSESWAAYRLNLLFVT